MWWVGSYGSFEAASRLVTRNERLRRCDVPSWQAPATITRPRFVARNHTLRQRRDSGRAGTKRFILSWDFAIAMVRKFLAIRFFQLIIREPLADATVDAFSVRSPRRELANT